jgi:RNA polymerase sigma factor (sigma-70 family)
MRAEVQQDLVERARRGDREAFRALAEGLIARLYKVALLMLNDRDMAEDAVQETLVLTWRDLPGLREPDRFDPWVHRILVRSVYRLARRERRQLERRLVATDSTALPDPANTIADADQIDRGFRALTPEHRVVLVVKHYLGLPDEEAALVLGIPTGTVKSRLHRAAAAMRAELESSARPPETLARGWSK